MTHPICVEWPDRALSRIYPTPPARGRGLDSISDGPMPVVVPILGCMFYTVTLFFP